MHFCVIRNFDHFSGKNKEFSSRKTVRHVERPKSELNSFTTHAKLNEPIHLWRRMTHLDNENDSWEEMNQDEEFQKKVYEKLK